MAVFDDAQQLYEILADVFACVKQHPDQIAAFTKSNLVIRMRFSQPTAEVLLDGRQPPLEVHYGERPGRADLEMAMQADMLHQIWLGRRKLRDAFFSGEIQTQGNLFRAMQLSTLFRAAENAYARIAIEHGLG